MNKTILCFIIFLTFTVAENTYAATNQIGRDKKPVVVKLLDNEKTEANAKQESNAADKTADQTQRLANITDNLARYTLYLAIIAIFQAMVALFQAIMFAIQLWMMSRGAKDASMTARAASKNAEITERALITKERAFVSVKAMRLQPMLNPQTNKITAWSIGPIWENSGSTPTRRALTHVSWGFFAEGGPETVDFEDRWTDVTQQYSSQVLIGPGAIVEGDMAEFSIERLLSKEKGFIWGWVEYDDIFPNTQRHRTEFCNEIVVTGDITLPIQGVIALRQYRIFNAADEECYRKPSPYNNPHSRT